MEKETGVEHTDSSDAQIVTNLEKFVLFENINRIKKFGENYKKETISDSDLERFISNYNNIVSITVWKLKSKWPVRYVKPDFWKRDDITNLSETDKQHLFKFLFVKKTHKPINGKDWYVGETWRSKHNPIISIGYIYKKGRVIKTAEIKVEPYLENFIPRLFGKDRSVYIADSSENIIFSYGKKYNTNIKKNTSFKSVTLTNIGWTVIYQDKSAGVIFSGKLKKILKTIFLFVLIIVFSMMLAFFVDRPLIFISDKVTSVARGDFSTVIPPQANPLVDKIGRIVNYMAREMERVKKINLGHIINEKNKTDAIIEHIADGVIVTDLEDRIVRVNSLAETWFSISEEEDRGRLVEEIIRDKSLKDLLKRIKDGSPRGSCEFKFNIEPQNEKRIFQAHSSGIKSEKDVLVNIVTVIRDITRIKEAERVKNELVSMVAHELKSPLSAIYGFSELLVDSKIPDPQAAEYVRVISSEATRLTNLINKFLDISRLESGRTQINLSPFNIKAVVVKTIDTFKNQLSKKKIRIVVDVEKNIPDAWGDQDMIEQVLVNLLSNAIKYSPKKAKIGIEAKSKDNLISVSVVDNGYGIPEESLNRIFDKFYRVTESEVDNEEEGTGLGLSLCREIISRHGGKITVKSKLGVGSVFSFTIPIAEK